jgi:putative transferase (TIGR04331 family)
MVGKTLVTTAIEQTWPKIESEPALFLGEWCKRYIRKEKWAKLNATVVPYHWDDRKILYKDYKYLEGLYENLLLELSYKLNKIHSVEFSVHYWRILIGPWLGYFIQILFDRWTMLGKSIESFEFLNCRIIERDPLSVTPNDMNHFISFYKNDDWNEAIYGQLLEKYFSKLIKIEKVKLQQKNKNSVIRQGLNVKLSSQLKRWVLQLSALIPGKDLHFFISTYLPLKTNMMLQLRLGQIPRIWKSPDPPIAMADESKRQWQLGVNEFNDGSFETILRQFIPLQIPTCYLEGYDRLMKVVDQLPWPNKPKSMFTSDCYSSDDVFKAWSAGKVETNTPLIIGQHGGHFGMNLFSFHEEHQIKIASKWVSWGWKDVTRPQIIPVGNLKIFGKKVAYNLSGGALMVEMLIPPFSYHLSAFPVSRQWLDYYSDQKAFLGALSKTLRKQVLLRLYYGEVEGWNQFERWQEEMPEVKLDLGKQDITKLLGKSRLCIVSYNATTYLETFSWNIPTIIFWNQEHWELREEVKPYFDLLHSVGIFHKTPESAAQHMTEVWDDVSSWWESSEVQNAKIEFCKQFSNNSDNLIGNLKSLFQDISRGNDLSASD